MSESQSNIPPDGKPACFERNELQEIRGRADQMAQVTPNAHWKHAYEKLSLAADHLDAMWARCEIP
jgi:hypothetical protein